MSNDDETLENLLADAPRNWGRWGESDEIGALNLLGPAQVLGALRSVSSGEVFPLGLGIGDPRGEPLYPGRAKSMRLNTQDKGTYIANKAEPLAGGLEFADDYLMMFLQGSSQVDALAHVWYDDHVYNGYNAESTVDGLAKASVAPLGEHGIVSRGVIVDIARYRGVTNLKRGESFTIDEVEAAAEQQGVEIRERDTLLIHTGWIGLFYREGPEAFYAGGFAEPGMHPNKDVAQWFRDRDIVAYGTDTVGNELGVGPYAGTGLHGALMRNLGVIFVEMLGLDALADACARDGRWDFLFVCSPLKIHGATGSPVNPIAIR